MLKNSWLFCLSLMRINPATCVDQKLPAEDTNTLHTDCTHWEKGLRLTLQQKHHMLPASVDISWKKVIIHVFMPELLFGNEWLGHKTGHFLHCRLVFYPVHALACNASLEGWYQTLQLFCNQEQWKKCIYVGFVFLFNFPA